MTVQELARTRLREVQAGAYVPFVFVRGRREFCKETAIGHLGDIIRCLDLDTACPSEFDDGEEGAIT